MTATIIRRIRPLRFSLHFYPFHSSCGKWTLEGANTTWHSEYVKEFENILREDVPKLDGGKGFRYSFTLSWFYSLNIYSNKNKNVFFTEEMKIYASWKLLNLNFKGWKFFSFNFHFLFYFKISSCQSSFKRFSACQMETYTAMIYVRSVKDMKGSSK